MAAPTSPTLHRLSPELDDRLVGTGLLEGEPVELVDGLLVHVTPQGTEHSALVQRLTRHRRRYARERVLEGGDMLPPPVADVPPVAVRDVFAVLDR